MSDTIRVRIAVLVDERGDWGATGASRNVGRVRLPVVTDADAEKWARELLPERWGDDPDATVRLTWVEADVPRPTVDPVETIEGEVAP